MQDPTAYYYAPVYYLACRGVIGGYSDGTFQPGNNTTRGQLSKIMTLAYNMTIQTPTANGYTFTDVPVEHTFYSYIETAYDHKIISGYNDATFRPFNNAVRGQISKIVHNAVSQP